MQWYYNLKISAKLIIGFLVLAVIAAIVGGVALVNINNMSQEDVELYEENTMVSVMLLKLLCNFRE
ncbi:methyl-accepting chemotaxis protein [Acetivibrio straminisolvens JCM 21531]|uniref:Methyl-accepting chemotaxis protein n=1 Tax=Acetivibrio straminisolvens JCM 21531 TaxID=1294263 RepID=W4VB67_9FIRM|nr:methyl-accepting chemotaxis protein [Acetivibrio straminisolvens JCM 21531]